MQNSGTRSSAAEIHLALDRAAGLPLRAQLENRLRELVRTGALPAGAVMPSTRVLAEDLGVSRRLVVEAYQQLTAEGYLTSRQRSATVVGQVHAATAGAAAPQPSPARYDLRPGVPALNEFPRTCWVKATAEALKSAPDAVFDQPDPRGNATLRHVLSDYLRRVRAVPATPERMLICGGFTQALSLITQALGHPVVAIEDPGLPGRDGVVAAAGGTHLPIPVDAGGARVDVLAAGDADAVVVTPAHQFPLGVAMAPDRRERLLAWATGRGRLIVEDDYDAEFRYDRQPLGALHGLAPDHTAYVGTVSKTLSPALRLGWIVLPPRLIGPVNDAKRHHDVASGIVEQLALARLIDSGVYERHLRRLRRLNRQRRDALLAALHRYLPAAKVTGAAAGLHLMLALPGNADAERVADIAARDDLALTPLDRCLLHRPAAVGDQLILGYGNIAAAAIPEAAQRLRRAVEAAAAD